MGVGAASLSLAVRLVIQIPKPIGRNVRISHAVPLLPQRPIFTERNQLVAIAVVGASAKTHADDLDYSRRQTGAWLYFLRNVIVFHRFVKIKG